MVCFCFDPSNPLENAKECCRPVPDWRKIRKLGREKWETPVPWAALAQLKGLLLRSVDHTSVWWHPLTAFSITMALSHPCPSSPSQLNELFPRQIKTGETAFTRCRRLGKGIQMGGGAERGGEMGPASALLWEMRGKGKPAGRKAWYRGKRCREHETLFTLCPGICRREGKPRCRGRY